MVLSFSCAVARSLSTSRFKRKPTGYRLKCALIHNANILITPLLGVKLRGVIRRHRGRGDLYGAKKVFLGAIKTLALTIEQREIEIDCSRIIARHRGFGNRS